MSERTDQALPDGGSSDAGEFVRFRFAGGRFDSHTIPFDVLGDLAAYRDLIVDVAKHLFRERNPDRQRVPRGFSESFQLGLSQVIQGNSATALARQIAVSDALADQVPLDFPKHNEFEDARNLIDRVIAAANDDVALPSEFPSGLVGRFNAFGQSLLPGEFAEISHDKVVAVRYDLTTRKRIVLSANATYENVFDQKFTLNGGELSGCVVHLIDDEGKRFNVTVGSEAECEKAIARRRKHVRILGIGQFDRQDRLDRIVSHREMIFTDDEPSQPFRARLDDIAKTPVGWFSDGNPAPDAVALAHMDAFVSRITSEAGVPAPYIYPLPEGGITAEWSRGDWEVSATIESGDSELELHAVNVETDDEIEVSFSPNDSELLHLFSDFWNSMKPNGGTE